MPREDNGYKKKRQEQKRKAAPVPYSPPPVSPTGRRYALKDGTFIDLSGWEPGLHVGDMKPRPAGVYCRASLGENYKDPVFWYYHDQCASLNIRYFPYHFPTIKNVQREVDNFLRATAGFEFTDERPPVLDAEYNPGRWPFGVRGKSLAYWYKTWLDLVERATGIVPWIYTNQFYWWFAAFDPTGKRKAQNVQAPEWTSRYPCIVAWYPDNPDLWSAPPKSVLPAGFIDFRAWQYADDGRSNGYIANDLNIWLKEHYG